MGWHLTRTCTLLLLALMVGSIPAAAQFFDGFDSLKLDPENPENGWFFKAGDGTATMDLRQGGRATLRSLWMEQPTSGESGGH